MLGTQKTVFSLDYSFKMFCPLTVQPTKPKDVTNQTRKTTNYSILKAPTIESDK